MSLIPVTKETFEAEVLKADRPVLVDFNAGWCGPCKAMKPILEEFADKAPQVKFASVDMDDQDELAEDCDVTSIPCLVLYKDGQEARRSVGLISRDAIAELIGG